MGVILGPLIYLLLCLNQVSRVLSELNKYLKDACLTKLDTHIWVFYTEVSSPPKIACV